MFCVILILQYLCFVSGNNSFPGSYVVKLADWNTGRVYFGEDYGQGPLSFGPVCAGNVLIF